MRTMKDSGVEWLGEIPSTWMVSKFRYAFREGKEVNGTTPVGEMLSVSGYKGVVPKVYEEESLKRDADQLETYRVVRKGQLAVNTMWLNHGGLGVSELEGHMSPAYRAYWINNKIYPRYAHHLLRSQLYISGYTSYLTGVRPNSLQMSRDNLMNFAVLLPPLEEQRGIVEYVEAEAPQIDTLVSKKEQLIEKLLERKQALITQVVTKGLDPNVPMKDSGVEWLGEVPENWKIVRIGAVAELVNGFPFDSDKFFPEGQIPLVRIRDLLAEDFKTFLASKSDIPSERYLIANGDLAIGMDGDFNSILWKRGIAAVNQRVCFLRFEKQLEAKFASFVIPLALKQINEVTYSTTVKHLSSGQIVKIPIPLPPFSMLGTIVEILETETSQIDILVEKTRRAIELLKERHQALITQVVTGKIDVRGFAGGNS
jgi:type I restriction enzyme S subunit